MSQLLKNSLYVTVFTLLALPLSYVTRVVLAHNLTLAEYGLLYALIGFFEMVATFNDLGFSETQVYFIPKFLAQKRLDKVKATIKVQLLNQLLTTFAIGTLIFALAPWLATHLFHTQDATPLLRLLVAYFIFKDFLNNAKILFYAYQEGGYFGSQEPARILLSFCLLMLAMSLMVLEAKTVAWIWVITYGVMATGYFTLFFFTHREVFRAKAYPLKEIYREFLPFLIPTLLSNNAGTLFSTATETMLVFFKGASDVGLYNIAKPISNLALAVTAPVGNLLKPYVSQIDEQQNHGTVRNLLSVILNAGVFLLLPFSVLLMFYSSESIVFLFGAQYLAASLTLKFIAFEILLSIMSIFVFSIVFGLGLQKSRAKIIYLSSAVSLVFSLLLIPRYGAVGVAMSNLAYNLVAVLGALYIIYHKVKFAVPYGNYAKIGVLVLMLIASQLLLKIFSPDMLSLQFILFIFKAGFGLLLYYGLGIFVFKILDVKFVFSLVAPLVPKRVAVMFSLLSFKTIRITSK